MKRDNVMWVGVANRETRTREISSVTWSDVAPFLSVAIIAASLFFVAFSKMEVRRMGYGVWKLSREERSLRDQDREVTVRLAKATRPERLALVAESRLTLRRAEKGQIIHMTESGLALEQ